MSAVQGTAGLEESVELAVTTRGGFVESRHVGSAIVLSPDGETLVSLGAPEAHVLTRSSLKPLQLLALTSIGLEFGDDEERTIGLASHNGSPEHVEIVRRVLSRVGLGFDALLCPADLPMGSRERLTHVAHGGKIAPELHCCSGKHAAMLATCVVNDWDLATYLEPTHPVQTSITETVQRFSGEAPIVVSSDGCGAPTLGLTLTGLARGMRRMAAAEAASPFPLHRNAHDLLRAARENGWVVCGKGSPDTSLIDGLGVFSKFGAEGTVVVATREGYVAAVTNLDGAMRGLHLVATELLTRVGAITKEHVDRIRPRLGGVVSGGGRPVGETLVTC